MEKRVTEAVLRAYWMRIVIKLFLVTFISLSGGFRGKRGVKTAFLHSKRLTPHRSQQPQIETMSCRYVFKCVYFDQNYIYILLLRILINDDMNMGSTESKQASPVFESMTSLSLPEPASHLANQGLKMPKQTLRVSYWCCTLSLISL